VTADSGWAWWRERRLPAELVHLDSAAAGRSSTATLAATAGVSVDSLDWSRLPRFRAG